MKPLLPPDGHSYNSAAGWYELGNFVEALAELNSVSRENQHHSAVLDLRWMICAAQSNWNDALRAAQNLIVVVPNEASGWLHCAYALRRMSGGGVDQALNFLRPVVEKIPDAPVIAFNLACYACQLDQLDEARAWFKQACDIGGESKDGNILIYTDSPTGKIGFVNISNPANPTGLGTVNTKGEPTSVTGTGNYVFVGVNTSARFVTLSGMLSVYHLPSCLADIVNCAPVREIDMGGQPDSVAATAEVVGHRSDEPDPNPRALDRKLLRHRRRVRRGGREAMLRFDAFADFGIGQHLASLPAVGEEWHELDIAYFHRAIPEAVEEV